MTTNKANKVSKTTTAKTAKQSRPVKPAAKPAAKTTAAPAKEEPKKEAVKPVAEEEKPVAKTTTAQRRPERQQENREKQVKLRFARQRLLLTQKFLFRFTDRNFPSRQLWKKLWQDGKQKEKKITSIKRAKLYVKPEEGKAYYVVNEGLKNGSTGAVDL